MNNKNEDFLFNYLLLLTEGKTTRSHYDQYREYLDNCTPAELNSVIDRYIATESDYEKIERVVAQFIRACGKGLDDQAVIETDIPFISILLQENSRLREYRRSSTGIYKELSKRYQSTGLLDASLLDALRENITGLADFKPHYLKLQNSLFPLFEKYSGNMNCLKLMWHIQDGIFDGIRSVLGIIDSAAVDFTVLNKAYGELFLKMGNLIYREERILFPLIPIIPKEEFSSILADIKEIGTAFNIDFRDIQLSEEVQPGMKSSDNELIDLSVGALSASQLNLMLTNLPLDITFVDENDNVRYFSQGRERIFPRSPGIIGRAVQNCHPPKSVHVVQKIVDDFKAKKRDSAEFWIQLDGRFIHIRYFPLFEGRQYRGVVEVSQDVSGIRSLEGEKRLLDEE